MFCFLGMKERLFCIRSLLEARSGYISRTQNAENHRLILDNHQHRPQDRIALERRQCCAFRGMFISRYFGIELVSSYFFLLKLSLLDVKMRKKK